MGADLDSGSQDHGKKGAGVKKQKKASARVDMTPMVDLGFLLITFFIFTTTMSSPKAFKLNVPVDTEKEEEKTEVKKSGVLTILLTQKDHIYYYEGELASDASNINRKPITLLELRDVIIKKKNNTPEKDFVVIIKPSELSTYKNVVDALDEMTISDTKKYAMIEITESENEVIKFLEGINK
jgi:biopolymer transport protein ExbD